MKDRIQARLDALDISPTEAARLAGFDLGYVRDILRDKKAGVQGRNLERLAFALQCEPGYLTGDQTDLYHDQAFKPLAVPVVGELALGRWLEKIAFSEEEAETSAFPEDSRFRGGQFDLIVRDTSVNRFAQPGQRIRFIDPYLASHRLLVGDLIAITRFKSNLRERTVRRLDVDDQGKVKFHLHTSDPAWTQIEPLTVSSQYHLEDGESFQVDGLAQFAYDPPHLQNQPIPLKLADLAIDRLAKSGKIPKST